MKKPMPDLFWHLVIGFVVVALIILWHLTWHTQSCYGSTCYPGGSVDIYDPQNQNPGFHPNVAPGP